MQDTALELEGTDYSDVIRRKVLSTAWSKKPTFYLKVSSTAEEIVKRIIVLNLLLLSQGMV
ncbi:hypothetical protein Nmel_008122 [Mimus melanotis]